MNAAFQSSEIVALGWTLLHFVWQSTAVALLYALVDGCCWRCSSAFRYWTALSALALMPLVSLATLFEQCRLASVSRVDSVNVATSQVGTVHRALVQHLPTVVPVVGRSELWIAGHSNTLLPLLDSAWLLGVLFLTARTVGGWWKLQALQKQATAVIPEPLQECFSLLAKQISLRRSVALRISKKVLTPMAFGLWRTVIILPLSAVTSLPLEQLQAVLAHELAHVRRWDYLCNLLQTCVECLFFFQPAVWWISSRARRFRELCCDEVAVKSSATPLVYAKALLQMEEQRATHMRVAVALNGDGYSLLNRIQRILGEDSKKEQSASGLWGIGVIAALSVLFIAPHVAHSVAISGPEQPSAYRGIDAVALDKNDRGLTSESPMVNAKRTHVLTTHSAHISDAEARAQYISQMHNAGYTIDSSKDLDLVARLRSVGVTPDYTLSMARVHLGKPTLTDLIALKSLGADPDEILGFEGTVLQPSNFGDVVTIKTLNLTPAYIAALKSSGAAPATLGDAANMKALGVTPEYARALASAGLVALTSYDLIALRALGLKPETARWLKATFADADNRTIRTAASLRIDAAFAARARANGFDTASLNRLSELKVSGLMK